MSEINRRRGRPPGPGVDRDARREALLDAAERAIARSGADVSLSQVAAEAGLTRSAVYAAFDDRDSVLDALAARHSHRIVGRLQALATGSEDAHGQTRAAVDLLAAWFDEHPTLAPALADRWRANGRSFVETTLTQVLAAGFAARSLDSAPAAVWARAMVGAVASSVEWWATTREISRDELVDHVTSLLWSGLSATNL
ncbi:TetR/AcrR family transcriptional regulator [Gordonia sp. HY285]|uniref:TetR/AcrR family transcriptional regulator n=1 Tax=Gordonia liuliyuniae TaxID=2911517 RepID=UPI001F1D6F4E|nr:TetR/AcrR family transcriptional regulator [Gordonia liuliyuniae]MCF8611530.1 TetR/AcrR family transcriptional regulator [Gordonia liuliyuniae]